MRTPTDRAHRTRRRLRLGTVVLIGLLGPMTLLVPGSPAGSTPRDTTSTTSTSTTVPVLGGLDSFYDVPDPLSSAPPGSIIRSEAIPVIAGLPIRTAAYRILYHSESMDGSDIGVSGVVVVPGRRAPVGGYPIVSWAHGTTGLASDCAPSRQGIDDIPFLPQLLEAGYVVAATDYEGLGTSGIDPYLVGQSEGQSVLDAARAARDLLGSQASDQVIVAGHSQGGQAALFAGQIAASYAPELFIAGVVSIAPVATVGEFVPPTVGRSANPLSVFTVASLYEWAKTYGNLTLSSLLTPAAVNLTAGIDQQCINSLAAEFADMPTDRIFRPGWESSGSTVVALETENEPGWAPSLAPILVVQGINDTLTPYTDATTLVDQRLCRDQHDTVQYDAFHNAGHTNVLDVAQPSVLRWMASRLSGYSRSGNTCPRS